jgi:[ribosomal protein S5]-alanine N-acetyltransferase
MKFDRIKTERLIVRRLLSSDAEAMATIRSHSEVMRFQSSFSKGKAEDLIEKMTLADPSIRGQWFQFAIELEVDHCLIGDLGFLNTDENGKSWIGFTLDPRHWNQGYALEAVRAILGYYGDLGITEIWASTDPKNESSMKLLRKVGFQLMESKPEDMIFRHGTS